jgi:putative ABC transport system permease protein
MFIKENILLAIAGLKSNKMRSLLTMLGIIIGIASVIGVVSVGNAMTSSVTSSMSSMGATNITVNVQEKSTTSTTSGYNTSGKNSAGSSQGGNKGTQTGGSSQGGNKGAQAGSSGGAGSAASASSLLGGGGSRPSGGGSGGSGGRQGKASSTSKDTDLMTMDQINTLQEDFSDKISSISINESDVSGKVKNDTTYANINAVGTNVGYQDVKNIVMQEGRYLAQNDIDQVKNVAVVSDKLVAKIFGNTDPIGQDIKVYTSNAILAYTVVGVYTYKSSGNSRTTSDDNLTTDLYVPITVSKKTATNKIIRHLQ